MVGICTSRVDLQQNCLFVYQDTAASIIIMTWIGSARAYGKTRGAPREGCSQSQITDYNNITNSNMHTHSHFKSVNTTTTVGSVINSTLSDLALNKIIL